MKTRSKGNLLLAHREKVSDEIHQEPDSNPTEREPIDNKSKASEGPENPACTGATDDATHGRWCGSWDGARMKRRCDGHGELRDEGKDGAILSTRTTEGTRAHLCLQDDQAGVEMLVLQVHVRGMCKRLSSFLEHDNELEETQMGALAERRWDGELAACVWEREKLPRANNQVHQFKLIWRTGASFSRRNRGCRIKNTCHLVQPSPIYGGQTKSKTSGHWPQRGIVHWMSVKDDDCVSQMDGNLDVQACQSVKCQPPVLKGWVPSVACDLKPRKGTAHLNAEEEAWCQSCAASLQVDKLARWRKKTSKGQNRLKYPQVLVDGTVLLDRWECNALNQCGCRAQIMLMRGIDGVLTLLEKGRHIHQPASIARRPRGVARNLKVELLQYVGSDMTVPKIMHELENKGWNLEGVTKTQVKNFLAHERKKISLKGTMLDFQEFISTFKFDVCKAYNGDECFIVNSELQVDEQKEEETYKLKLSMSCPTMVKWAQAVANVDQVTQLTLDATFGIVTNDSHILMASGITDCAGHWFPLLYSIVPTESTHTTVFHLDSLWQVLGSNAMAFFDNAYILKDAGAGLHAGVRAFMEKKECTWHQQDCYAHLSRVDGNLQQACKKYQIPTHVGQLIGKVIKNISYSASKKVRDKLLQKFEQEFAPFQNFMVWWKQTYGGPFKYWARCDAPPGYPVSNQGHESHNNTFKRVHMPSRSTQRRVDLLKALAPLKLGVSSFVREKTREYEFQRVPRLDLDAKLWQDVNSLMMCSDWALRQCVEQYTLFPSKSVIEASWCEALKSAEQELLELKVHSTAKHSDIMEVVDQKMQKLLHAKATQHVEQGCMPLDDECLADFFHRKHQWDTLHQQCSCWRFLDKEVCKHICAKKVADGLLNIPSAFKIFQFSKFQQLKIQSMRSKTYKQRARDAVNDARIKRMKLGEQELRELVLTSQDQANLPTSLN